MAENTIQPRPGPEWCPNRRMGPTEAAPSETGARTPATSRPAAAEPEPAAETDLA